MLKEVRQIIRAQKLIMRLLETQKAIKEMNENCTHELVVEHHHGAGRFHYRKCLLCQQYTMYYTHQPFIEGKRYIDLTPLCIKNGYDLMADVVQLLLIKTAVENPDKDFDSIVDLTREKYYKRDEDFQKIAEELNVKL